MNPEVDLKAVTRPYVGASNALRDEIAESVAVAWRTEINTRVAGNNDGTSDCRNHRTIKVKLHVVLNEGNRAELFTFDGDQFRVVTSLFDRLRHMSGRHFKGMCHKGAERAVVRPAI